MRGHMNKKKWFQGLAHKGDLTVKGSLDMHESLLVHGISGLKRTPYP
jgi:hypothetical protein